MIPKKNRSVFEPGYIFADKYKVLKLLGQGGYGDIYSVEEINSNQGSNPQKSLYAIKIESNTAEKKGLDEDITILSELQDSPCFPKLHEKGMTQTHRYLAMELLGPSISNTRRQMPQHKFSLGTTLRIGIFMLECIKNFHEHGFVHRDVKPGNFLIRSLTLPTTCNAVHQTNNNNDESIQDRNPPKTQSEHTDNIETAQQAEPNQLEENQPPILNQPTCQNPLVLIDFGLSKQYIDPETHHPFPERPKVGFRGTAKYASLYAHSYKDQCPRDDLISWCYSMVELVDGRLPWGNLNDNSRLQRLKIQLSPKQLFKNLPEEFVEIWQYLNSLTYLTVVPKYDYIIELLSRSFYRILRGNRQGITLITSYEDLLQSASIEDEHDKKSKNRKGTRIIYDETGSIRPPFDWEMLSQERIESYSAVSTLPNAYQAPMPPLLTGVLISQEDEELEISQNPSKCKGCLMI